MPSPVGHSLSGLAVALFALPKKRTGLAFPVLYCLLFANLPDLDFLPGLLLNRPALFHGDVLHSVGSAVLISAVGALLLRLRNQKFTSTFILGFAAYGTHLLLDLLNPDGRPPHGIPILWPISDAYFLSPWTVFIGIRHASTTYTTTGEFIRSVLSLHNLLAVGLEILIFVPVSTAAALLRGRIGKRVRKSGRAVL